MEVRVGEVEGRQHETHLWKLVTKGPVHPTDVLREDGVSNASAARDTPDRSAGWPVLDFGGEELPHALAQDGLPAASAQRIPQAEANRSGVQRGGGAWHPLLR